jgi:hypothetical protein
MDKLVQNTNQIIDLLEKAKEAMSDNYLVKKDWSDDCQITNYGNHLEPIISELKLGIQLYQLQSECKHSQTTGMVYIGHDSHHKYYENSCKDCGLTIDKYEE